MARCAACERRKPQRSCPGLGAGICSACCGAKRQRTIACPESCHYLQAGLTYQGAREMHETISHLIAASLRSSKDVFQIPEVADYTAPVELCFVHEFYNDGRVCDENIYDALAKVYWHRTGRTASLVPGNRCEEVVFGAVAAADASHPLLSGDVRAQAILRVLRTIKSTTGGPFGPRNYLELIYSMFYTDGRWSEEFESHTD